MQHDSRAYLWDVRQAADGEALNQLSKADPALAASIPDLPRIIAFRNVLIHGYAVVEHPRVWRIIQESLPPRRAPGDTVFRHPFTTPSNPSSNIAASRVSSVNLSSRACAMSSRSTGSGCAHVRLRTASMWRGKIGSRTKPCASSYSVIVPCGKGNWRC